MDLAKKLLELFVTGGASTVGGLAARVGAFAALVAALTGPALWLWGHKDVELVSFTVMQSVVIAAVAGVVLYVLVLLAHRAPPP